MKLKTNTEYPLSKNQERIWFLNSLSQNQTIYHNPSAIQITGSLDKHRFMKACIAIFEKHEQLRITIHLVDGKPFQRENCDMTPSFHYCDLENTADTLHQKIREIVATPFDFENGPLCQFALLRLAPDRHMFILNIHHIISDGWSKNILLRDILDHYSGKKLLHEPRSAYRDYVLEQNILNLKSSNWHLLYPQTIEPIDLPVNYQYPDLPTGKGALYLFDIQPTLSLAANRFAKENGTTLFSFLLFTYAVTLFKWTGQRDFAIGTAVSGRTKKEWEEVVGLFVNTIAIPVSINPKLGFLQQLSTIHSTVFKFLSQQHIPFEEVVKKLNPARDMKRNPLFQVMLQYDNFPLKSVSTQHLSFSPEVLDLGFAQVDLSMTFWPNNEGLSGSLEYRSDLFEPSTISRFHSYFLETLETILSESGAEIDKPLKLPAAELKAIQVFNHTSKPLSFPHFISKFQEIAQLYPNSFAIISPETTITYSDLAKLANRLANYLCQTEIAHQKKIALVLPASIDLAIALLAAAAAGAIFSIIDPQYPMERKREILSALEPDQIIYNSETALDNISNASLLSQLLAESASFPTHAPEIALSSDDISCIIFTSGTSGNPKGVELKNASLVNIASSFIDSYNVTSTDRIFSLSSVSFASFLGELIPPLCAGAAFILPEMYQALDPDKLVDALNNQKVTILSTVPSFIRYLNSIQQQPAHLRFLLSGGEPLFLADICNFKPPLKIVNGYGLTESCICSSYEVIDPQEDNANRPFSIGKPIANTELYVLDPLGRPSPVGVQGEICIGGIGLMKGYLNDPQATKQAFQQHPFKPDKHVLKTGDLGIRTESGLIHYLGRKDALVKVRGFRISLLEIENKILESNRVKNVAVRTISSGKHEKIIAAIEPSQHTPFICSEIRKWLESTLPSYMIPSDFIIVASMPLTRNGKVDWSAIESLKSDLSIEITSNSSLPFTDLENQILGIWRKALNKNEIGIEQNFFDIGGHSILLMEVFYAIKQQVDSRIEVVDLFQFPTIRSLASFIKTGTEAQAFNLSISERAKLQKQSLNHHFLRKNRK